MSDASAKPEERNVSSATIELSKEHLGIAAKVEAKVGSRVRIVLFGSLREVNRSAGDPMDEGGGSGQLVMDVSTMKMASNNEIAELFDEELDG